ncbi:YhdT family protein [Seminibacterium arietis]|uniref:YhdT family protein n=1 Tax=Seminibacterium arietis TaxID=1173502 RepID=A0ABW3I892_9PAST
MKVNERYKQTAIEARWAIWLTVFYAIGWCVCAYLPQSSTMGALGFPLWFELSCIYLPIAFVIITYLVVKKIYKNISLDKEKH